jgi:hypothetical protein
MTKSTSISDRISQSVSFATAREFIEISGWDVADVSCGKWLVLVPIGTYERAQHTGV